jgi:hypothetical protein
LRAWEAVGKTAARPSRGLDRWLGERVEEDLGVPIRGADAEDGAAAADPFFWGARPFFSAPKNPKKLPPPDCEMGKKLVS